MSFFSLLNEEISIGPFLCEWLVSYRCEMFPVVHEANLSPLIVYFHLDVENDT